ncbi:alpha/beta hydrolase [Uliginosibacterium gangwonense]|uniref:alpha/beta hydrolase n=1 Tax=Uliginosibacterium gangwonense TaxID=392736 RepID=UPI00036D372D|nr:alpha/beta hydrolase-fold protein [Uliginosibacterium gangwonense]
MILRGTFFSTTLEMETNLTVLIPNNRLRQPLGKVAYLLHGLCGRSGDWLDYTMLPVYAEQHDLVFVMPEVARSFYNDMQFGQKFFSYVVDELPQIVRNVFQVSSRREDTGVIGASMGGYGALKCALSRPEQYAWCAAFSSASLYLKEGLERQRTHGNNSVFRSVYGERLLNDFEAIFSPALIWREEDEITALAARAKTMPNQPQIYLACGSEDYFCADNQRFKQDMDALQLDMAFESWAGKHDWVFFNEALEKSLQHFFPAVETPTA